MCICTTTFAQEHRPFMRQHPMRGRAMERIHAIKVAYITDKLHFTSEQSAGFWPIYNQYEMEVRTTRRKFREKYAEANPDETNDAATLQFIDDNLDYQQEILNIRRKYNDEFLKVITPQQVAQLYKTEKEFTRLLIQRLKERRGGRWNNDKGPDTDP